jgi:hypothetical protein
MVTRDRASSLIELIVLMPSMPATAFSMICVT